VAAEDFRVGERARMASRRSSVHSPQSVKWSRSVPESSRQTGFAERWPVVASYRFTGLFTIVTFLRVGTRGDTRAPRAVSE
jgi:hypothetical protein